MQESGTNKEESNLPAELKRGELIDFEHMRDCQVQLTHKIQEMWSEKQPRGLVHVNVSGIMLQGDVFVKVVRVRANIRPLYGDLHVDLDWPLAVKILHKYDNRPISFHELVGMILRARVANDSK